MADDDRREGEDSPRIRTGRIGRTAGVGGMVAGQGLRWAGTRLANLTRGEERSQQATDDRVADRLDIDAAMLQLSPEYRAAVALRDLVGMDYAEIAEVLELPTGTVRSRISRGRAALADVLGNQEPASERPTGGTP